MTRMFIVISMRSLDRTILAPATAMAFAVLVVGMAYGSAATAAGLPSWLVVLTAVLVLSASSELLFVGVIAVGGLPWVAVVAALLVNARNVIYGFSASTFLPKSRIDRYLLTHLVNDESVAFALAQPRPSLRLRAFRVAGVAILVAWPLGALIGVLIGRIVPDPGALGIDAAFPAIFVAILVGAITHRTVGPALTGATIAAVATPFVAVGVAPVLGVGGLLTIAFKRGRRG